MKLRHLSLLLIGLLLINCEGIEGPTGNNSLIDLIPELPGTNCPDGGLMVISGVDLNENDSLDEDEIERTEYICSIRGETGKNSLLDIKEAPLDSCPDGGVIVFSGIDSNENGILDEDEIDQSKCLCKIKGDIGKSALIEIKDAPIDQCSNGGITVVSGIDLDEDGILDENEIDQAEYICSIKGDTGKYAIIDIRDAPLEQCENGGLMVLSGIDENANSLLDDNEIQVTKYLCRQLLDFAKEIRFSFEAHYAFNPDRILDIAIPNFNINNYPGVDSISFGALMKTFNSSNELFAELVNVTSGTPISNTKISTYSLEFEWVFTDINFINEIPQETFTLGFHLIGNKEGSFFNPVIILYKSD